MTLRPGKLPANLDARHVIFITRPNVRLMDYIAENIHGEDLKSKATISKRTARVEFHLFFVPRVSQLCEKHLKIKGVYGSLTNVGALNCPLFAIDNDLLSMELKDTYRLVGIYLLGFFLLLLNFRFLLVANCTLKVTPLACIRPLWH